MAAAGLSGEVDVIIGTLGKALGGYGAYACASAAVIELRSVKLAFLVAPKLTI